jgi:hypothetical protein
MNINEQTDAFLFELQNVVNRFRAEYDLNHATIIGTLEMVKMDYLIEGDDVEFIDDMDDMEDETCET